MQTDRKKTATERGCNVNYTWKNKVAFRESFQITQNLNSIFYHSDY